MTKVFGSTDAVVSEIGTISQPIGSAPITIEGQSSGGGGAVDSVNGETGVVVLDSDDVNEGATNLYLSAAEQSSIASAVQPGDNISVLNNNENYLSNGDNISLLNNNEGYLSTGDNISLLNNNLGFITAATAPVSSVNGQTNDVILGYMDIQGLDSSNFVMTAGNQPNIAGFKSFSSPIGFSAGSDVSPSIQIISNIVGIYSPAMGELGITSNGVEVFKFGGDRHSSIRPIGLAEYVADGMPIGEEGDLVYCSNGDTGSPCLAVHDGSDWKVVALGATVSSS